VTDRPEAMCQAAEGLAQLRSGLDMYFRTGSRLGFTRTKIGTAEILGKLGRYEEALRELSEGAAFSETSDEENFAAESARVRGVLLLCQAEARPRSSRRKKTKNDSSSDALAEAEACFIQALAIAQRQGARSWELRAATSLAALWSGQGKSRQAHDLLAGILGWFTEGTDTLDLRNARTFLAQLG
jgi:hypothetical protein